MPSLLSRFAAWLAGPPPAVAPPAPTPARPRYAYLGSGRAVTVTHAGRLLLLDTRDLGMTPHLAISGEWERSVEDTLTGLLRPGATVVEVGANHGYHTIAMADAVGASGRVHAFEANPRLLPLLAGSIALNGLSDRVTIHGKAAAAEPGEVALLVHPDHAGSGHLEVAGGGPGYTERHLVEAVRIDDAIGPAVAAAQLMRLDCEGAEPLALRGAEALIRRSPDLVIVLEWSVLMMRARVEVTAFAAWLRNLGFAHAWRIEANGRQPVEMAALPDLPHSELVLARRAV